MYELVFLTGVRAGAVVPVTGTMMSGRSPDCDLEVPDLNASRFHARFEFDGQNVSVADNGSSNGTWVNEERVSTRELGHGDIVRLGETRIRVQRRSAKSTSSSSGPSAVFDMSDATNADLGNALSLSVADLRSGTADAGQLQARLDAILEVSEALAGNKDLEDLYGPVLEVLFGVFPQASRGFLLIGSDMESLEPRAMRRRDRGPTENMTVSASLCRAALERRAVIVYSDDQQGEFGNSLISLNILCAMVVPLMVKDEIFGLLVIDTPDRLRPFSEADMGLAAAICRQIAVGIKNAMLINEVEVAAVAKRNLSRFLPGHLMDQVESGQLDLDLGGTTCQGTVVFADIIGFTRLAESMHPQEVVAMMNGFFNGVVPCIEGNDGAIDKFMGDCIMATWGIPFDRGDAAHRALSSCLEMQTVLFALNRLRPGKAPLKMGIGMASGPMVAGNIGSVDRREYTVLGNTVNTASRIQGLASRDQVLVATGTLRSVGCQVHAVRLPAIKVKNKEAPIDIFSVRGVAADSGETLVHLPLKLGEQRVVLIRRLTDGAFVALHEDKIRLDHGEMMTDIVELPPTSLGQAAVDTRLPAQDGDGGYRRSLIRLADPELGGILAPEPLATSLAWADMVRSAV